MAKKCPFCSAIQEDWVTVCTYCGEDLTSTAKYNEIATGDAAFAGDNTSTGSYADPNAQNVVIEEITDDRIYKDPKKQSYTEQQTYTQTYTQQSFNQSFNQNPNPNYNPAKYNNNNYPVVYSDKSRIAAGLLQFFLGSLGIGRFYLGYVGMGLAQLFVCMFTCGLGAIWPFIDSIYILAGGCKYDGSGKKLL